MELNVTGCKSLTSLHCQNNSLEDLFFSGCEALEEVDFSESRLVSIQIKDCPNLRTIRCYATLLEVDLLKDLANTLPDRRGLPAGELYAFAVNQEKLLSSHLPRFYQSVADKNWNINIVEPK